MAFAKTLDQRQNILRDFFIVLGASILISLSAWISIRLPFTPVPICCTMQAILLFSVLLGRRGTYATFAYLAQGAMGLPVFAGGAAGAVHFFGPTGGYLIGFLIASYVVAILSERLKEKSPIKIFAIMLLGNAMVFVFGLPHLALFVGAKDALTFGLFPFIGLDLLKLLLAQQTLKALKFYKI